MCMYACVLVVPDIKQEDSVHVCVCWSCQTYSTRGFCVCVCACMRVLIILDIQQENFVCVRASLCVCVCCSCQTFNRRILCLCIHQGQQPTSFGTSDKCLFAKPNPCMFVPFPKILHAPNVFRKGKNFSMKLTTKRHLLIT